MNPPSNSTNLLNLSKIPRNSNPDPKACLIKYFIVESVSTDLFPEKRDTAPKKFTSIANQIPIGLPAKTPTIVPTRTDEKKRKKPGSNFTNIEGKKELNPL